MEVVNNKPRHDIIIFGKQNLKKKKRKQTRKQKKILLVHINLQQPYLFILK